MLRYFPFEKSTGGEGEHNVPRAELLGDAEKFQQCRKYFIEDSTIQGAPNLFLAQDAI